MDADPSSALLFLQVVDSVISISTTALSVEFAVFFLLLIASAFVSGSEVALFSLDAATVDALRRDVDKANKRVLYLLEHSEPLLVTILILNNVINVAAATLAAVITLQFSHVFVWSNTAMFVTEVIVVTFVLLIIGVMTPKLTAVNHSVRYSRLASGPLKLTPVTLGAVGAHAIDVR